MNCTIRGIFQKVDFENNTLQNYLTVVLPTGEAIQCLIEDAVAERVIAAHAKAQLQPPAYVASAVLDDMVSFGAEVVHPNPPVMAYVEPDASASPPDDEENMESEDDGVLSV